MNTEKKLGFATRQIHAGHIDNAAGALCAPIYQTSTFAFSSVEQGGARFAGKEDGYIYSRLGNPTLAAVEEKLASLEGGEAAMAAASGMGAISSALWTSVVAGDEIVADETLYGCTYALLNHGMTKFGVKVTLTDLSDIENLKKNLTDKTRVVYFETPCNPTLKLLDIEPWEDNSEQEQGFHVVYNWRTFWAPWWKDDWTNDINFQLVQQDGGWKIKSIGNG